MYTCSKCNLFFDDYLYYWTHCSVHHPNTVIDADKAKVPDPIKLYEIQKGVPISKKRDTTYLKDYLDGMEVGDCMYVRDIYEALLMQTIARKTERRISYRPEYQPGTGAIPVRVWRLK